MKSAIFAAALLVGGAAYAQSTPPTPTGTTPPPDTSNMATSQTGTQTATPGNQNPERDARGIPVVSDPAEVPAGANQSAEIPAGATFQPNPNQAQVFTPRPASQEYQACSRTVTDNCVQSYERGRSPNR